MAIIGGIVLAVVLVFALGYVTVAYLRGPGKEIQKQEKQNEREVNQTSQQYVETQVRAMRDQINQYNTNAVELAKASQDPVGNADTIKALNTAQQGIVTFVRTQSKTIATDAVPADIRQFLSDH